MKWRDVPGWEGAYEVSDTGAVRSRARTVITSRGAHLSIAAKVMVARNRQGYPTVSMRRPGERRHAGVHVLVAQAFLPNPLGLPEVNHKDSQRDNPAVGNLEWVTSRGNHQHAAAKGRHAKGERNGASVLTERQVSEIRGFWEHDLMTSKAMAERYKVTRHTIRYIGQGLSWRGVPAAPLAELRALLTVHHIP
jgi:hypothetical protein